MESRKCELRHHVKYMLSLGTDCLFLTYTEPHDSADNTSSVRRWQLFYYGLLVPAQESFGGHKNSTHSPGNPGIAQDRN